jgi:hypothetical protein
VRRRREEEDRSHSQAEKLIEGGKANLKEEAKKKKG